MSHNAKILRHCTYLPVISVTLGQHQWEQKLKDDLSIIHRVSGDVGNKPVPELRQGPANKLICFKNISNHVTYVTIVTSIEPKSYLFLLVLMSKLDNMRV